VEGDGREGPPKLLLLTRLIAPCPWTRAAARTVPAPKPQPQATGLREVPPPGTACARAPAGTVSLPPSCSYRARSAPRAGRAACPRAGPPAPGNAPQAARRGRGVLAKASASAGVLVVRDTPDCWLRRALSARGSGCSGLGRARGAAAQAGDKHRV